MQMNRWNANDPVIELLPCPFCGGEPKVEHIGNEIPGRKKRREVRVKCSNRECRIERTDAALHHGFAWLEMAAAEGWNQRFSSDSTFLAWGADAFAQLYKAVELMTLEQLSQMEGVRATLELAPDNVVVESGVLDEG